jgi:hypothetical protein
MCMWKQPLVTQENYGDEAKGHVLFTTGLEQLMDTWVHIFSALVYSFLFYYI